MKFNEKDYIKEIFHVLVNYYEKVFDDFVELKPLQNRIER